MDANAGHPGEERVEMVGVGGSISMGAGTSLHLVQREKVKSLLL